MASGVQEEATIDEVLAPLLEAAPEEVASDVARSAPSEMRDGNGAQHDEGMTSIQGLGVSELKGGNEGECFTTRLHPSSTGASGSHLGGEVILASLP